MNNNIYGMTGGQASPTTPIGAIATTAPYGAVDPPFDICRLAIGAGATFVARATIAQPQMCESLIRKGIGHDGFSVIEIMTHCHTQFGRKNKLGRPMDNFNHFKDHSIMKAKADSMLQGELAGKYVIGELFYDSGIEEYTKKYDRIIDKARRQPI
jgi:2-oxoglutarate ferredoxin oxidoreductase subunit beta